MHRSFGAKSQSHSSLPDTVEFTSHALALTSSANLSEVDEQNVEELFAKYNLASIYLGDVL